jgi:pseudouridine-5'-phosphate glycosidase
MSHDLTLHPEVAAALEAGRPVVALESTVITHGLAYPENARAACEMESAVREGGAVPATVAVLAGRLTIGLTGDQLEALARRPPGSVRKTSRRDLAIALARREDGATTVAATMIAAYLAGIPIFATGGIGGVHRGHPFDVSADLIELGRTPVAVVCSGPKSILDLALTREVLETQGVPVLGYRADEMPAFYARSSGLPVDARLDGPAEAAAVIRARQALNLRSGLLITVPVPESEAFDLQLAEEAILQATGEADRAGVSGPSATPWLLRRVAELTAGRSLRANLALLRNNGFVAGQIAAALGQEAA